jgi:hypothetical protein
MGADKLTTRYTYDKDTNAKIVQMPQDLDLKSGNTPQESPLIFPSNTIADQAG